MSRLPERDLRAHNGKGRFRLSNVAIGIITVLIFTIGPYLAFTKHIPFTGHGYTISAVFENAVKISKRSPVRIAGVEVGQVLRIERDGNATRVVFTVSDNGRPVKEDAAATIRPRIFIEGNFFIDLDPGSPSSKEMPDGGTIPVTRTGTSVQLDQVLTSLQSPEREDLTAVLEKYGSQALMGKPGRLEDLVLDPAARGLTGAEALRKVFDYGGEAGKSVSYVTEAFRGTDPEDLRKLISGAAKTFGALSANRERLQALIDNFNTFTGALANESGNLRSTVALLGPTLDTAETALVDLNASLPGLRGWSLAMTPAVKRLPNAIEAADPWFDQALPLLSNSELGGFANLTRRTVPGLAGAAQAGMTTTNEMNKLGRCTSEVLVPTGDQVIESPFGTGQPSSRDFFYMMAQVVGETQNFDGNGKYLRAVTGGGDKLLEMSNAIFANAPTDSINFANVVEAPTGTQPTMGTRPPKRADVPCHKNAVPNLNGPRASVGPPSPVPVSTP
jgi:phospholipid/cholesterol/gamma-HCH transport system substrate-binding protein